MINEIVLKNRNNFEIYYKIPPVMIIIIKKFDFHNFAKHLQKARGTPVFHGTPVKKQCPRY